MTKIEFLTAYGAVLFTHDACDKFRDVEHVEITADTLQSMYVFTARAEILS
jgi:hypothetical protein